ncbi:MAG: transcription antitermination factor NusB [Candidatus Peregrinibacteria bacterium]|nr:transcription antitermination factor NusB [Candidatus Peregrinibacteria bacterium]
MSDKSARRDSRIIAVEVLFAYLARKEKVSFDETFLHVLTEVEEKTNDEFAEKILKAAVENVKKIKIIIRAFAPEFPLNKIAPINLAILILGIAEMKFIETPPVVVINEYIEIAKMFGEDKSAGFMNGVLDAFRKNLGLDRSKKKEEN